ncbi:MAG TPA: GntR family transcriptional regulator [Terriglobales bacterium]|nr:GntR family transcriptional regulator [Terriglobales bacterium]
MATMQLWFSRASDISIREQLVTQVILGIVSGELAPGNRLPSTRAIARRFRVHPNTVSAGYRDLQQRNWVQFRKGSGVYVSMQTPSAASDGIALDRLISEFFRSPRNLKAPLAVIRSRLRQWLNLQPPDHFLLIEPDHELARIVVKEMQSAVGFPVKTCEPKDYKLIAEGAVTVAVSFSLKSIRPVVPNEADLLTLQVRSAGESLAVHLPASRTALVGIASGWQPFLKNARTMLIAAGFDPDCLVVRDTTESGWQRGLKETAAIVCDTVTAEGLNSTSRVLSFPLLAESSLKELRDYEQFIRSPLTP